MKERSTASARANHYCRFLALTYGLTWILWTPLGLSGQDGVAGSLMTPPAPLLSPNSAGWD